MKTTEIYYFRILVDGYKPTEISVKKTGESTFFCRFNCVNFINHFNTFGFIVETHKYNDPVFICHGQILEEFLKKAWSQIYERIDTPDYSEKVL